MLWRQTVAEESLWASGSVGDLLHGFGLLNAMSLFSCCDCREGSELRHARGSRGQNAIQGQPESLCGIGINFRADRTGALLVSSLIEGGPSHQSGEVRQGDVLYEVDKKVVLRSPLSHVSASLLGPKGSSVNVVFLRDERQVHVRLVRAPVANLMSVQKAPPSADRTSPTG